VAAGPFCAAPALSVAAANAASLTTRAGRASVGPVHALLVRLAALREVLWSPRLRALLLSWCGNYTADWASFVAFSVYFYEQEGLTGVGILGLVRMGAAVAAIPLASAIVDRYPRQRLLLAIQIARGAALALAAAVLAFGGASWLVLVLVALIAFCGGPYRPAHYALMPTLARSPQELVAANVGTSMFEGVAVLVGPALAGVLLAVTGPYLAVAVSAAVCFCCAVLVACMGREPNWRRAARPQGWTPFREVAEGFRVLAHEPNPRLIVGLIVAQAFVRGLLNVLLVTASIHLLRAGDSGVGFLNSAFGAGALAGGLGGVSLLGRRRLADPFGLGLVLWGAPIALVVVWPTLGWALLCMAVVGAGNSVLDIAGYTLIQRSIVDVVLGRVFATLEIVGSAAIGIGSIAAPQLVGGLGMRGALIATGVILPVLAVIFRPRLQAVDEATTVPRRELELLASVPFFEPLAPTTLEKLAMRLRPLAVRAGTEVVKEGEGGETFYLVESGQVDVIHGGKLVATLGAGQYFGEIALLHEVPRVATCVARSDAELYELERQVFVSAVSGNEQSHSTIGDVVAGRLDELEGIRMS
jgi:MFS family permease